MSNLSFDVNLLRQFTGTEGYCKVTPSVLLTDGALFLAEGTQCFWLMTAIASYLSTKPKDYLVVAKLKTTNSRAILKLEDGNDNLIACQYIEFTDFPLAEITLYCCFDGTYWVVMLTSEY